MQHFSFSSLCVKLLSGRCCSSYAFAGCNSHIRSFARVEWPCGFFSSPFWLSHTPCLGESFMTNFLPISVLTATQLITVLESFIQGVGGSQARLQVSMTTDSDSQATWSLHLMTFVHSLARLVYPCCMDCATVCRMRVHC